MNPEAPWPEIAMLRNGAATKGRALAARLPVYPRYVFEDGWLDDAVRPAVLRAMDADGLARDDRWAPGMPDQAPRAPAVIGGEGVVVRGAIDIAVAGGRLSVDQVVDLFKARGSAYAEVVAAADALRSSVSGDTVTYAVNRNINYTNVCGYRCGFCAFSKGS